MILHISPEQRLFSIFSTRIIGIAVMTAIETVIEWLQKWLGLEGSSLSHRKSPTLLANEGLPDHLTEV